MQEEKLIDIKGTFSQFVKADEPELSQEEAIMKYQNPLLKKAGNNGDDGENSEEQEHLKRVKKELLASLERVKKLEQQIFKEKEDNKIKVKVKGENGGGVSQGKDKTQKVFEQTNANKPKERD